MTTETTNVLQTQQTDEVGTALAVIATKNKKITEHLEHARALHVQFRDVAFDVSTPKGMKEAKDARHKFRSEARFPVQKLQEEASKQLGDMRKQLNKRCDEIVAEIQGFEDPIDQQIKAREEVERAEREEAARKEAERVNSITERIARIGTDYAVEKGTLADLIESKLKALNEEIAAAKEEDFAEMLEQAQRAYTEAHERLTTMLADQREREEFAEQRRQLEAQQEELRQQQQEVERQRTAAREKAEREEREVAERAQAVEQRIQAFIGLPARLRGAASGNLESNIRTLNDTLVLPGDFGDRLQEAEQARAAALQELRTMHANALQAEDDARVAAEEQEREAKAQRERNEEARRQELAASEERARKEQEAIAAKRRVQSAASAMCAVLEEAMALGDARLSEVFGAEWVRKAKAAMAIVAGEIQAEEVEADESPAQEGKTDSVKSAVLLVIANCFDLAEDDSLLALEFGKDLDADAENMGVVLEELGYALPGHFPAGIPLHLTDTLMGCKTVADMLSAIEQVAR